MSFLSGAGTRASRNGRPAGDVQLTSPPALDPRGAGKPCATTSPSILVAEALAFPHRDLARELSPGRHRAKSAGQPHRSASGLRPLHDRSPPGYRGLRDPHKVPTSAGSAPRACATTLPQAAERLAAGAGGEGGAGGRARRGRDRGWRDWGCWVGTGLGAGWVPRGGGLRGCCGGALHDSGVPQSSVFIKLKILVP